MAVCPLHTSTMSLGARELVQEANDYLQGKAREIPEKVHAGVLSGSILEAPAEAVAEQDITDIVLASHGRTGLARVVLGSVADGLIHRLHLPMLVIPALAEASGYETKGARSVPFGGLDP